MKRLFTVILAAVVMMLAVSCNDKSSEGVKENSSANNGVQNEQTVEKEDTQIKPDIKDETPVTLPSESLNTKFKQISVEEFKEIMGYSMLPYDIPPVSEKNMLDAAGSYNGDVELFYYNFIMKDNARAFFADTMNAFEGEPLLYQDDGDYELWKIVDADTSYMMARVGKSIVFGSSKKGFESLENWFYGLGYADKNN